jgi:hypothetical protein
MDFGHVVVVILLLCPITLAIMCIYFACKMVKAASQTIKAVMPDIIKGGQGILNVPKELRDEWKASVKRGEDRYNNLPPLGQARVDRRIAQVSKYAGVGIVGITSATLFSAVGVAAPWLVPTYFMARWAKRNWEDQSDEIEDTDARREQILHPPDPN